MGKKLLFHLLVLLGFAGACSRGSSEEMPVEYGCPHADFSAKGMVTDTEGNPIAGIGITAEAKEWIRAAAVSGPDGRYAIREEHVWPATGEVALTAADTDGPEGGGEFASQTKTLTVTSEDYVGGEGWYEGCVEKKVDFVLSKTEGNE